MAKKTKVNEKTGKKMRDKQNEEQKLVEFSGNYDIKYQNKNDILERMEKRVFYIQEIIRSTSLFVQKLKENGIYSNNEIILCSQTLKEIYEKSDKLIESLKTESVDIDKKFDELQSITNKLYSVISNYGTYKIEDLLYITFGSLFNLNIDENIVMKSKYDLICKYVHPICFKNLKYTRNEELGLDKSICNDKIIDTIIDMENYPSLECFDIDYNIKKFYKRVYGIIVVIHNKDSKKTLIIDGIVDDIQLDLLKNEYLSIRKQDISSRLDNIKDIVQPVKECYLQTFTLKEILSESTNDMVKRLYGIKSIVQKAKKTNIETITKKFNEMDSIHKRNRLIEYLIFNSDTEIMYITHMLYDFVVINDNEERDEIYNSFPWNIRSIFRDVSKKATKHSQELISKYDNTRYNLEQQIFLLRVPENVKEKAMIKYKEIKGKPDEIGAKTKQYLEGLVKIPFGNYREEPVLKVSKELNERFCKFIKKWDFIESNNNIQKKPSYTNVEIYNFINSEITFFSSLIQKELNEINNISIKRLNELLKTCSLYTSEKIIVSKLKSKEEKIDKIIKSIKSISFEKQIELLDEYFKEKDYKNRYNEIKKIQNEIQENQKKIQKISEILDESIYGQKHAKNQIMKIICQWINGEQSGYAFGFEGSPGIGKTSLAKKGISKCLEDENGVHRPFSFIALGGSTNGSSLEGHGYTYLNSTWGRIVDILMDSKCMNPIIYIDELDKVSKSENGKEIIGILTHLIDQTQNTCFQDKYFSGIDIDVSKALFIFSYNDAEQIDRILLDRIHRIRFDNLTIKEKIVITKDFILPEINKKMGFHNSVEISDETIEKMITDYTCEPGVRKLKEVIFDLYGELNIELMKPDNLYIKIPVVITYQDLETKYLKKYRKNIDKKISLNNQIGVVNGMWANNLGMGGILPIETHFFPSSTFLELKLTGLQGDVMKESMNVSKTLAWNLCDNEIKKKWIENTEETKTQGIHIHCPDGAVSKDGPSAGTAITIAIYSLLNEKPVRNNISITGEIDLNGNITAIGGLDNKILGAMKAGVEIIIYPKDNHHEYENFVEKHGDFTDKIRFVEVSKINEVFTYVFV